MERTKQTGADARRTVISRSASRPSTLGSGKLRGIRPPAEAISILGEPLLLTTHAGKRVLKHPKWSLTGTGKSLAEAQTALFEEAMDIADYYCRKPDELLDAEARKLKHFLELLLG
ncbi:MAG: hypothetical protein ACHQNE_04475 [Candidatus Kapaibacterium sp.]